MNIIETDEYKAWKAEYAEKAIAHAIASMADYGIKPFDHWAIDPCPSYFDSGDDTCFGIYAADEDGSYGDYLFVGENERDAYAVAVDLLGEDNFRRGTDYRCIWS